jgi:hypothetical protein
MTSPRILVFALVAASAGCLVTPLPDPPDLDGPRLDRVALEPDVGLVMTSTVVRGSAGTALPGATLVVVPLSNALPPALALVAEDGSFETTVDGISGDELRLSLRFGSARSTPVDVVVPEMTGPPTPARRDPCIVVEPELDFGEIASGSEAMGAIVLRNECTAPIVVGGATLRQPSVVFTVDPLAGVMLDVGTSVAIGVRFAPPARGAYEQTVLLAISGAVTERRPVTLFGSAP